MSQSDNVEELISTGPVLLSLQNGIAQLKLNRPDNSNGLNVEILKAMYDAVMQCHGDPRVKVLVLSGAGRHFCAGGDVKVFASKGEQLPDYLREATSYLQIIVSALMRLNAPVIASVQGFAAGGGGFGFVCAADMVVAAESSKFLAGATRVGMAPDAGLSVTLQNLVGFRKAVDILLTNPVITAAEALDMGLVSRVVPDEQLLEATHKLAEQLATSAPLALSETKRLLWNGMGSRVETCLADESRTVSALSGTEDSREGLAAVIEKRTPNFIGK
ncbi:enoyl-CoA hydratase-related protein [Paraglaciecola agarilytica]|jgi:2-(1,2-epoxy-1,2-dihydrophenyl)acetyl-CoA isomerase|uniref:enoyl-CoA hydratase/isomerase family protein n=1 Tax=Paraglaciecola chathamensis TaxID=368405 RepID=UPI00235496BE|nr:enoyl-CoA hydratase-related protein [Paraglaciecola agarilytica]|tara:strand:- start:3592 stop:4413 length:822 start_codon:yes stop_codon:yes gene_type:complete